MIAWHKNKLPSIGTYLLIACLCGSLTTGALGAPSDVLAIPDPAPTEVPRAERPIEAGDATVASQTGALQYAYPIAVPPGRGGNQPALALAYSSQGAVYGGVAAGWSLQGLHTVTRDPAQSGLERQQTPRYVSSLVGGRELVPVAGMCCSVCTSGKACGNSCISQSSTCHQPPGCACDADDAATVLDVFRGQNDSGVLRASS
jgi:hypothetical protein